MARSASLLLVLALGAVLACAAASASAPPRRAAAFFRAARAGREWGVPEDGERAGSGEWNVPEDGEITFIPGADFVLPSQHYGGYVTLRGGTRRLYYYMVMSQGDFLRQGGSGVSCALFTCCVRTHTHTITHTQRHQQLTPPLPKQNTHQTNPTQRPRRAVAARRPRLLGL